MPLTGVGDDPTPATRREIIYAQSGALGSTSPRYTLLLGNKTSAGSETVEVLGTEILDDQNMRDRFGARSELYQGWRTHQAAGGGGPTFAIAVTEGAGPAGSCTFTFAGGAASDTGSLDIEWGGMTETVSIASGDTAITQAAAFSAAVNSADSGTWPFTAAIGGGGSEHIVTVTAANNGDRATLTLSRIRATYRKSITTTCTKSAVTNGGSTDDFTTAYATAAAAGDFYYQVSAKHATAGPTSTDNGIGEHAANITTQALPVNGKDQIAIFGLVGTNAQAVTVATAVNNPLCRFFWAENNDWSPMMIAAHFAAILRVQHAIHPAANLTGYVNNAAKGTILTIPVPYTKTDIPTAAEIKAALNGGVSPITFNALGAPRLVREVTSYSLLPGTTTNDYRCREGHITSAEHTYWARFAELFEARRQPFLARTDPAQGAIPLPNTTYPSTVRALAAEIIDDFTGPNPMEKYRGPILNPDEAANMKSSMESGYTQNGGGGHTLRLKLAAVIHNNSIEVTQLDVTAPQ